MHPPPHGWCYCVPTVVWIQAPCSSVTLCFAGPRPPRSCGGMGPCFFCPCDSPGAAFSLPRPPTSGGSPGPLTFHHMSGEVTPAKAGMSLGAAGPPPLCDQVAGLSLREPLGGLFLSFYLQGETYPPQAAAAGPRQTAAPQRHRGAAATCFLLTWFVVCSYSLVMCAEG